MDKLEIIKGDMRLLYPKITKERIDISKLADGNYNTYRKLIDLVFKTFDTYSKLNRNYLEDDSKFANKYYNFLNNEANEISKLLDLSSLEQYRCLVDIRNKIFEKTADLEVWYKVGNVVECEVCENVFPESKLKTYFYLSYATENGRMNICKNCANELCKDDIKGLCKDNDLYYNEELWSLLNNKINSVGEYLKNIFSLSQYKNLRWKDSIYVKNDGENIEILQNENNKIICDSLDYITLYKNNNGKESEYLLDQKQFNNICKIKPEWIKNILQSIKVL